MRLKFTRFQLLVHAGALLPLVLLVYQYFTGNLTVNPIQEATQRTGRTALVMLVLTLACTPANTLFGLRQALKVRRALGLYAFFYAALHLFIFSGIDYGFQWAWIREAIFEKPFALVGFSAFLILLPLALTSTRGWQKRLKRNWKWLHRLVYLAGLLVIVHYTWAVKADIRKPLTYGVLVVALLSMRLPAVRRWVSQVRYRVGARRRARRVAPVNVSGIESGG